MGSVINLMLPIFISKTNDNKKVHTILTDGIDSEKKSIMIMNLI